MYTLSRRGRHVSTAINLAFTKRPACETPGAAVPNFRKLPPCCPCSQPTQAATPPRQCHPSRQTRDARSIISLVLYMFTIQAVHRRTCGANASHALDTSPLHSTPSELSYTCVNITRHTLAPAFIVDLTIYFILWDYKSLMQRGYLSQVASYPARSERKGKRALFPTREYSVKTSMAWS